MTTYYEVREHDWIHGGDGPPRVREAISRVADHFGRAYCPRCHTVQPDGMVSRATIGWVHDPKYPDRPLFVLFWIADDGTSATPLCDQCKHRDEHA